MYFVLHRFTYTDALTGVGTFVRMRREAVEKLIVTYVAGFSLRGFSYFFSHQRETFTMDSSGAPPTLSSSYASKIVQVHCSVIT